MLLLEKAESNSEINTDSDSENNQTGFRAKLTLLKNPSQSLKPADIKSNLDDWNLLPAIYKQVSDVIVKLDLRRGNSALLCRCGLKVRIISDFPSKG